MFTIKLSEEAKELHQRILDKEENPCQYYNQEVKDELIKAYMEEPEITRQARLIHNEIIETGNHGLLSNAPEEVKEELLRLYYKILGVTPLNE